MATGKGELSEAYPQVGYDKDGQREFLDFLRDWLKDRPYVALAYMTGILPIKKYGQHSALNMFTEYSMMSPRRLTRYAGFTEDEVRGLRARYGRDFGAMRDWYDGYDAATCEVFVPNREVLDEFRASTKSREWEGPLRAYERSKDLLRATWERDAGRVAALLEEAHDRAANRTYNDEAALSYAVQLAYYAAQKYYTEALELDSGKGYADICYLPSPGHPELPALVVELKHGSPSETALEQIRRRNYPDRLEHYRGNTLLVAVSYDRDARSTDPALKRHSCVIEEA